MTEENSEQLITQLRSDDLTIRYQAAFELLRYKRNEGIEVIVEYINQRHFRYFDCYKVIDHLATVKDERIVEALIGMLDWPGHVVGNALYSLLTIGTERSIQAVFDMLMTPSPWLGWGTAQLIASQGNRFTARLLEASHHEHPLMRARSVYALGIIAANQEDKAIETCLIAALEDEDRKVRERAAAGLVGLTSSAVHNAMLNVLECEDIEIAQWAAEGLYTAGLQQEKALTVLIQTLTHENWLVKRNAVWALTRIGDKRAVPALIDMLQNDDNPGLRGYTADALAASKDKHAIEPLQATLSNKDEDKTVRAACVKALSELAAPDILPQFINLLNDTDKVIKQAILDVWEQHNFQPDSNHV